MPKPIVCRLSMALWQTEFVVASLSLGTKGRSSLIYPSADLLLYPGTNEGLVLVPPKVLFPIPMGITTVGDSEI